MEPTHSEKRAIMDRENLNAKIEVCLELFEQLNVELSQKDSDLMPFYDDVKNNMVKVLNEIVENYVYRDPKKMNYEGEKRSLTKELKEKYESMKKENDGLKTELEEAMKDKKKQQITSSTNATNRRTQSQSGLPAPTGRINLV